MKTVKRIITLILCLTLMITIGGDIFSAFSVTANAAETVEYSNVLDDLKKDSSFNPDDYPAKADDYSLQVIQIAEGANGELFVYVYQPSAKKKLLQATSINISTEHKDIDFYNYSLTFLNSEGVLHKYIVDDFAVSDSSERYYEITSIYRQPVDDTETIVNNGNLINEVAFNVGKSFKITDLSDGSQSVYVEDLDVITVIDKHVGFVRYPANYFFFNTDSIDVHYVAFSTDRKIDNLLEADVYYSEQSFEQTGITLSKKFGVVEPKYSFLKFGDTITYEGSRWWSNEYSWNVIETPTDFLKSTEEQTFGSGVFEVGVNIVMNEEVSQKISNQDWVLRFACTDYKHTSHGIQVPYDNYYYTIVSDVSILRLAFETDGVYYNLGVVDNKQTGSLTPDNDESKTTVEIKVSDEIFSLFLLIAIALVIFALWNPLCAFFKIVIKGVSFLLEIILSVIMFPFNLIASFFKKK